MECPQTKRQPRCCYLVAVLTKLLAVGDVPDHLPRAVPGSRTLSRGSFHFDADPDCTPAERRPGVPYGNLHHRGRVGNHVSISSQPVSRTS